MGKSTLLEMVHAGSLLLLPMIKEPHGWPGKKKVIFCSASLTGKIQSGLPLSIIPRTATIPFSHLRAGNSGFFTSTTGMDFTGYTVIHLRGLHFQSLFCFHKNFPVMWLLRQWFHPEKPLRWHGAAGELIYAFLFAG